MMGLSKSGKTLAIATLVSVLIISMTQALTRTPITNAQQQWKHEQLSALLPTGKFDNDPSQSVRYRQDATVGEARRLAIYTAIKDAEPIAFVLEILAHDGYSGNIELLLGIDVQGTIIGARVIKHQETPGLGDDIDHRKSDWIQAFDGQSTTLLETPRWNVKQSGGHFDAFTGATITPRAVITAIHQALLWYDNNRTWMMKP